MIMPGKHTKEAPRGMKLGAKRQGKMLREAVSQFVPEVGRQRPDMRAKGIVSWALAQGVSWALAQGVFYLLFSF